MCKQYILGEIPNLENPEVLQNTKHPKYGNIVIFKNNLKINNIKKHLIFFENTKSFAYFELRHILNNQILNRFFKSVCNVGYLGNAKGTQKNNKIKTIWSNMISRCYDPKNKRYYCYGGKGITVSEKWLCFEFFLNDFEKIRGYNKELFEKGLLQLDKDKNNGKIYSLENCEFITQKENISYQNKMKKFKAINNNGEIFYSNNQKQFSLFCGVPDKKINEILRKKRKSYHKWTFEYCDT